MILTNYARENNVFFKYLFLTKYALSSAQFVYVLLLLGNFKLASLNRLPRIVLKLEESFMNSRFFLLIYLKIPVTQNFN